MSEAVLISRIKEMKCGSKIIPQEYIDCFNDYIEKVINTRVDEEVAVNFEAGKFKTVNDLVYAYKNLEKVYTKSRQKIANLELKLADKDQDIESLQEINQSLGQTCNNDAKEIEKLREQLAEEKNRNKKLNHEAQKYYEDAYCNGFQKQTAIAELEKVIKFMKTRDKYGFFPEQMSIAEHIDQQIKSLKGEK